MGIKFLHRRRNLGELEFVARVRNVVAVNDVILVAEDRKATGRSRFEADLLSLIATNLSFLKVTLAKRFCFGVR